MAHIYPHPKNQCMSAHSNSCPGLGGEWPDSMPCPRFLCTCPPADTCPKCTPSLWTWKPSLRSKSQAILSVDEVQVAIARSPSAPTLHTPTLLQDVRSLMAELDAKGCDVEIVDSWHVVKNRIMLRATVLGHEWADVKNPPKATGTALGLWVGEVHPDDSVAVVWWTDEFIDYRFKDHSYDNLIGRNCSTWERVALDLEQ